MARPSKPLPVVPAFSLPVAINAGQFVRNKGGQRNVVGTSLDYLLAARRAGATGWFLAPGDLTSFGFATNAAPRFVSVYSNEGGIAHPQYAVLDCSHDANNAASDATRSYGNEARRNAMGALSPEGALAVLLYNVAKRADQLNPSAVRALRGRGGFLVSAMLGNADALAIALHDVPSRDRIKEARDACRAIGAMFTL